MAGKKVCVILSLLLASVIAEKKINLDDIESDNLRSEIKPSTDDIRADETSYNGVTDKLKSNQQDYQPQNYDTNEGSDSYAPQSLQNKYPTEGYHQDIKYVENDVSYQQTSQPVQQYVDYQQHQSVETTSPKSISHAPTNYEITPQQQLVYQQEVAVGNQYQSVQQKIATEKYIKSSNKDTLYVNIPMDQLLSYYPNLALSQLSSSKNLVQPPVNRLSHHGSQQIAIPVYTPSLTREQIYAPSKIEYQIQPDYMSYSPKYSQQHTEAILPTKQPNKLIYAQSTLSRHVEPQAQHNHQQYLQEIVYAQPGAVYAPPVSSSYHDVYSRPSVNSLGQNPTSQTRHQQQQYTTAYSLPGGYYTLHPTATLVPQQLNQQIYQHQQSLDDQENYETVPESPGNEYDLPKLPAENFKPGDSVFRLVPVHRESSDSHYTLNHLVHSSGPKSLLDSYIPSRLIAAQDSERYRERPIKLERGFVPSKIHLVHSYKKRKAE